MAKVLILGDMGSIGSRYKAILNYFKIPWVGVDVDRPGQNGNYESPWDKVTHAIIATPTYTHYGFVMQAVEAGIPVLCEKPLSCSEEECIDIVMATEGLDIQGFVVCNYKYAFRSFNHPLQISYDYFRTGSDGLWWDVCQLLYLDPEAKIGNASPFFHLTGNGVDVGLFEVERSYAQMISDFVDGKHSNLWTLEDGLRMTKVVKERMKNEGIDWDTGTNRVDPAPEKDL